MKRFFFAAIIASLWVTGGVAEVHAQAAPGDEVRESITLSPVSKRYEIAAGAVREDKLTIINDGEVDFDFTVYTRPYSVTDENYTPDFTKTAQNTNIYQWVQFPQAKFHLKAGASIEVPYIVRVPQAAKPGGHYGVIFAETQPSGKVEGSGVVRKKRVGSILYATVKGQTTRKGALQSVSVPFWQAGSPLKVVSRITNEGNTDFVDTTTYRIKDIFGNVKSETKSEYPILPQTIRRISHEWTGAAWIGLYNVELTHDYLGKSETTQGYVVIVPRYLLILGGVLALIGGGFALRRRFKK